MTTSEFYSRVVETNIWCPDASWTDTELVNSTVLGRIPAQTTILPQLLKYTQLFLKIFLKYCVKHL